MWEGGGGGDGREGVEYWNTSELMTWWPLYPQAVSCPPLSCKNNFHISSFLFY